MTSVAENLENVKLKDSQSSEELHRIKPLAERSCNEETSIPVTGKKTGEIPLWLKGALLRNGPGIMEVGEDRYQHWFDGLSVLQSFKIQDGEATYRSRFLRSDTFQKNMKANRIVVNEFGTAGHKDPCASIFDRFKSYFSSEMTDNANINVLKIGDGFYAATETNLLRRVDVETLESKEQVNISNYMAVNTATAHAHYENDGTVYNMGNSFKGWPSYNFLRFPPSSKEQDDSFKRASIVCHIPSGRPTHPSYYHSFGVTENYLVFAEQSLVINLPNLLWNMVKSSAFRTSLQWETNQLVKFHLVEKKTGKVIPTKYVSNPFMVFHHANAYEEDGHIIIDLCAYENGDIIKSLELDELKSHGSVWQKFGSQTRRYVLPMSEAAIKSSAGQENLVTLKGTAAVAYMQKDGSILCHNEVLSEGLESIEMPQVNYDVYNGKKYSFLYAIGRATNQAQVSLVKLNVIEKTFVAWSEPLKTPTEPVFIPTPDSKDEDDGILLASLLHDDVESKVTLLVLNAKDMRELARVEFNTNSAVTNSFHGPYVPANSF